MKLSLHKFSTDPDIEARGATVRHPESGVELRIARMGNAAYSAEVRRLVREQMSPDLPDDVRTTLSELIARTAASKHILVGWSGMKDLDTGDDVPYSSDLALQIFRDPGLHDFYEFVLRRSDDIELFRAKQAERALGNSQPASAGNSSGGSKAST